MGTEEKWKKTFPKFENGKEVKKSTPKFKDGKGMKKTFLRFGNGNQRLSFPGRDGNNFISAIEIHGDESEMNCELSNAVNALIVFESDSKVDAGTFPSMDHSPSHISIYFFWSFA